jgi:para-nitrobenzyl esterase
MAFVIRLCEEATMIEGGIDAETMDGPVRGARCDSIFFRRMPYARPSVGPIRFRPPEPPHAWTERRDATRPAGTATQASTR